MITNYYTLRALVREWEADLVGNRLADAFSQARDELTLAFGAADGQAWVLRASVRAPVHYLFRSEGYSRPRRNVATLFEDTLGRAVTAVGIAERDRLVTMGLEGGLSLLLMLFGPRANVFLVDEGRTIIEAFQADAELAGQPAPEARPAPVVSSFEVFEARWQADRKTVEQAVTAVFPLFDRALAGEVVRRSGVAARTPDACTAEDRRRLFEAARALEEELERPEPRVYWRGRYPEAFSLVKLGALSAYEEEGFERVGNAAAVFVRKRLALEQFRRAYEPLEGALAKAVEHYRRGTEGMLEELSNPSRADRYERWGHLLMASATGEGSGRAEITLPDLFDGDTPVTIPLDPSLSAVENAQRFYDRARRTRLARARAEERLVETEAKAEAAAALLERLRAIDAPAELEAFRKEEGERLTRLTGEAGSGEEKMPFRRYRLPGEYEVWVGKNAKQNDLLTFRYAQKHDLWMHARGVPGSHAVLRLPSRNARPGRPLLEQAASIAAYHSKAAGSGLVPVMVTERKFVRKPKGAAPGAVVVEREQVLIVEPKLPEGEGGRRKMEEGR